MNSLKWMIGTALFFLMGCAKEAPINTEQPIYDEPFTEGVIEMGMYSQGVDLGFFIKNVDFSRDDVDEQLAALMENEEEAQKIIGLIQQYSQTNPMIAFAVMLNSVICTYHVKGDVVMGKATGLGYVFDNYHDATNDVGQLYLSTLVQTDEIPAEDRELSVRYTPSEDLGLGYGNEISTSMFDKQTATQQEVVGGYACKVSTYTLKPEYAAEPDPDSPVPSTPRTHKIVVYTSDAFSKTINFTHPFYLPEDAGILKLEIHYDNSGEPTMVMQPENIVSRAVTDYEMQIKEVQPVYELGDTSVALKMLAILMSGWGALDNSN